MSQLNFRISLVFSLPLLLFFANCSSSEMAWEGSKVKTNQGTIMISELTSEDPNVQTVATIEGELFIEYPDMCWGQKNGGRVQLFMDINEKGVSTNTKITRGIGMGCDTAAHTALKNAKYTPALDVNGNPIAAIHNVTIIFKY